MESITRNMRPVNPIRGKGGPGKGRDASSSPEPGSDLATRMDAVISRILSSDEIDPADTELYDTYRMQVQYEMRKGRVDVFRRLQDIINVMLDSLEDKILNGEHVDITPSQMRLYISMFLDQTRDEFDSKPEVLIDQRQQTVVVNTIEVEKTYEGRTIGEIIDGDID